MFIFHRKSPDEVVRKSERTKSDFSTVRKEVLLAYGEHVENVACEFLQVINEIV